MNTWAVWLPLISRFGVEAAYNLWRVMQENPEVTAASWDKLLEVNRKTIEDYVKEAAARLGVVPPPPPIAPTETPTPTP